MRLSLDGTHSRRVFAGIVVVLFLAASVFISKTWWATVLAAKLDQDHLQRAIRLDPSNVNYHLNLGRSYEYFIPGLSHEKAVAQFEQAANLDPQEPSVWLELAAAAEFQGEVEKAGKYLQIADRFAPRLPVIQWSIGNYYLLHGDTTEAFRHWRVVLEASRDYDQIAFRSAWKASGDARTILEQLIPQDVPAEFSYLYYLTVQGQYAETHAVWERIREDRSDFTIRQAAPYVDYLVTARRPADAYNVWRDLKARGVISDTSGGTSRNLLTNGDFEEDLLNLGFGWRTSAVNGVYVGLDTVDYHSPGHSLLVIFPGTTNLDYRHFYEYAKVDPGKTYRVQAYLKVEGITTDSGPRLEVRDVYDPGSLDIFTEDLTGTSQGWTSLLLDFKTGPETQLIVVGLARLPSPKLDNQIAGKVWLDDVRLSPQP